MCGILYCLSRIELTHVLQPRIHPLHSTPIVSIVSCLSYLSSILASRVRSCSVRVCTVQTRIPSLPCAPSRPLDSPRALRRLATPVFLTRRLAYTRPKGSCLVSQPKCVGHWPFGILPDRVQTQAGQLVITQGVHYGRSVTYYLGELLLCTQYL